MYMMSASINVSSHCYVCVLNQDRHNRECGSVGASVVRDVTSKLWQMVEDLMYAEQDVEIPDQTNRIVIPLSKSGVSRGSESHVVYVGR